MKSSLGVNIDHVATLREARKIDYPDPITAAALAEIAGASGITAHLREDRRHIQDRDMRLLRDTIKTSLNMEMALNPQIVSIALSIIPDEVCIVPEKRQEISTEGGLDVIANLDALRKEIPRLQNKGIRVSLFIDPDKKQIDAAYEAGSDIIELHTGQYAESKTEQNIERELGKIIESAHYAASLGLRVNAGHGLHYQNTYQIALIPEIEVLNIGHSIISRAVFSGLDIAVRDMIKIIDKANDS